MEHKRTKIVCTIGPASETVQKLSGMMRAGMDVVRLNFSHGSYEHHRMLIQNIRKAAKQTGRNVALLQDLQGPKIRVGDVSKEGVVLRKGSDVVLTTARTHSNGEIPVQYTNLHKDVKAGDRILLDDGLMELEVNRVKDRSIYTTVCIGGTLISHKGITVPTASLSTSAITPKDEKDLRFGVDAGVDFIALSFVRSPKDIIKARRLIATCKKKKNTCPSIIAKIEKHEALQNLDAIIEAADGIMIARGDLALETRASEVPVWQKTMIQKCLEAAKPVITATQMLDSMTRSPRPTRAEISDVANAVIDHTDATMLSQESAVGEYPVETVRTMSDIITDTEASPYDDFVTLPEMNGSAPPMLAMSAAACMVAKAVGAPLILVTTQSGFTARAVSRHRPPHQPIVAVTDDPVVYRQLALSWGVYPRLVRSIRNFRVVEKVMLPEIRKTYKLAKGSRIVAISGLRSRRRPSAWDEVVRVIEV
jgi:pyruvate kinase